MKGFIKIIASDKIIRWGTLFSGGIILVVLIYGAVIYHNLPPVLPLYNQMPWGEDRLGTKPEFFILPGMALIVLVGNTILSAAVYERMPLVSRALTITCLLVSLVIGIFIFRTFQLLI